MGSIEEWIIGQVKPISLVVAGRGGSTVVKSRRCRNYNKIHNGQCRAEIICFKCRKLGHWKKDCPVRNLESHGLMKKDSRSKPQFSPISNSGSSRRVERGCQASVTLGESRGKVGSGSTRVHKCRNCLENHGESVKVKRYAFRVAILGIGRERAHYRMWTIVEVEL